MTATSRVPLPRVSVVVNYYNPGGNPRIAAMVNFALESLSAQTEHPLELIISDGSGVVDDDLASDCGERGWLYLPSERPATFAESYNVGMRIATGEYLVWMASDIFVASGWEQALITELLRTGAWMAAPYLTNSDYPSQTQHWVARMTTFTPTAMTFNLNLMTRDCYERVGPMDERFSGAFNDIDYLIRIRQAGGEAIITNAGQVLHVGRATLTASTMIQGAKDHASFLQKYPDLASPVEGWQYDIVAPVLCRSPVYRGLMRASHAFPPRRLAQRLSTLLVRLEPLFHAC